MKIKLMKNLFMKCLSALLSLFLLSCGDDEITSPVSGGSYLLCYRKANNRQWDICLNDMSGSNCKVISYNVGDDYSPRVSPNNKYIAYWYSVGWAHVYLYDVGKDSVADLMPDAEYEATSPEWTPDSKKIIYTHHKIGDPSYIYYINPDGSDNKKLLDCEADVKFYDDSYNFLYKCDDYIYQADMNNPAGILLLDLNTVGEEYTNWDDFNPAENKILLTIAEEPHITNILAEYDINNKTIDTLSKANAKWQYVLHPKYSPDYSKIAFIEKNYEEHVEILTILEGEKKTELVRLTDPSEWFDYGALSFSPDGKYLAYVKNIDNPGEWVSWSSYLYIINISTKQITYIDGAETPVWLKK